MQRWVDGDAAEWLDVDAAMLREIYLDNGQTEEALLGKEEGHYLLRNDLLQALFDCLPVGMVRFSCHIVRVKTVPGTSHSTLQFHNGSVAIAKECFANEERQLLQKVVEMLASSSARKKKLRYWQEDAHEFFQSMLDRLHSFYVDLKLQDEPSSSHANSFINQIFGGHLRSQTYSYK